MSYSHRGTPSTRITDNPQPPPVQGIPETILIECNRANAPSLDNGLNSDPSSWTNNFSGGIQIKKGDSISINSATLNSIGVGDLINFTLDNENGTQDNKATWIHSFYVVNDGKNNKRESCCMDGSTNGALGEFRFDTTNNDCDLYRWTNTGAETIPATREVSYYQDKFMPLRVNNTDPQVNPQDEVIDIASQTMGIVIYTDNYDDSFGAVAGKYTYFSVNALNADGSVGAIQDVMTKNIFQRGRNYAMTPVNVDGLNNPAQLNDASMKAIFTVLEVVNNVGGAVINAPDGVYVRCCSMTPLILSDINERQAAQTKSVNFIPLCGTANFSDSYGYCPVFYNWEDQLFNYNDDVYLINYELLDPNTRGNKSVQGIQTGGAGVAKGKVTTSNVSIYNIDLLGLPSGADGDVFPVQGYGLGQFKFRLQNLTVDDIAGFVGINNGYKQFGVRIYTAQGYKYGFFYLGTSDDTSTVTNKNTINVTSDAGIPVYFNIDGFQELDGVNSILVKDEYVPTPVESENNPHQILMIGKLIEAINVRYYNTLKQTFVGNFTGNKNLRDAGAINKEAYWVKQPFVNQTLLLDNDTSVFNPVHIDGYTGGTMRNFNFFIADDVTLTPQFVETFQYVKHYEHFSFEIDSQWNSPPDIATKLTDQTHVIDNARAADGSIINDSAGKGIPHNRLCIPVWTTSNATEGDLVTNANLVEGSFKLEDVYTNVKRTPPFEHNNQAPADFSGDVDIFFRTLNTSINYPSPFTNDASTNPPYNTLTTDMGCDFNQGNALMGNANYVRTAKTFVRDLSTGNVTQAGFPITYIPNQTAFVSQMAGANDISFGWNDNISRFSIGDLHVGIFSIFDVDESQGGEDEVKIYVPAVPYKKNQTRAGGVYVQNWYSLKPSIGMGLQQIIEDLNLDVDFEFYNGTFDEIDQWFLTANNRDVIGERFWNKLGYSENQVGVTGSLVNVSTNNELDTATAIASTAEPAANRPAYTQLGNFARTDSGDSTASKAGYEFSSLGNLNQNNHSIGMSGVQNTEGSPVVFVPHISSADGFTVEEFGKSTGVPNNYIDSEAQYNPDREMNTYYTISTQSDMSTSLDAENLPVKTKFSYFYILTNLVETNFYSSKFGGAPINCIGTINKLNSDNDFYFSYSSPQRVYATKDRVLTSITTTIRNTDFSSPALISDFSSVIYQIDRFNPQPETIPPPIFAQQEEFFNRLNILVNSVIAEQKMKPTDQLVNEVIEDLYIGDVPTEDTEEITTDIDNILERMRMLRGEQEVEARAAPAPAAKEALPDSGVPATDSFIPSDVPSDLSGIPLFQQWEQMEMGGRRDEEPDLAALYNEFLTSRPSNLRITKKEFVSFLELKNIEPDVITLAVKNLKSLQDASEGLRQQERAGRVNPELASRYRRGGADLRRREFEGRERPPPAYVVPPSFEEEGEDPEEE